MSAKLRSSKAGNHPQKQDEEGPARQAAEANALMREFLNREASGLDAITGETVTGGPTIPWVRGNQETWVLELIAGYGRHFQKSANAWFVLQAYDASMYLRDRATHKDAVAWVDVGIYSIVKQLLAGRDPLPKRTRQAMRKTLREGALCLAVITRMPPNPAPKETSNAVNDAAKAHGVSEATVWNAWTAFQNRRKKSL